MSSITYSSEPPRALVTFSDVDPAAETITVYRTSEGRAMEVRGGVDLSAATPFVMDYEIAVGVLSSYRAQQWAADGTDLGFTGEVSYAVPDTEGTWLQQPLAPEGAIRVRLARSSGDSIVRPIPGEIIHPEGATAGRMLGGQRRGITGHMVRLYANLEDLGKIDAMMGDYAEDFPAVLLLRTPPPWRVPRVYFMGLLEPEEFNAGAYTLAGFNLPVTEVEPPYGGIVKPLLRRKDLDAAYATRALRSSAYATRQDRDTDYSLAGLGG